MVHLSLLGRYPAEHAAVAESRLWAGFTDRRRGCVVRNLEIAALDVDGLPLLRGWPFLPFSVGAAEKSQVPHVQACVCPAP